MSIRIGLTMSVGLTISVMSACVLPGFAYAEAAVQTQKDITWGLGLEIAQARSRNVPSARGDLGRGRRSAPAACAFSLRPTIRARIAGVARRKPTPPATFRRSTLEWRDSTDPSKENAGQRQLARGDSAGRRLSDHVGNDTIGGVGVSGTHQPGDESSPAVVSCR